MASPRGLGKGLDVMIPNIVGESKEKKQKSETKEKSAETIVAITKVEPNRNLRAKERHGRVNGSRQYH